MQNRLSIEIINELRDSLIQSDINQALKERLLIALEAGETAESEILSIMELIVEMILDSIVDLTKESPQYLFDHSRKSILKDPMLYKMLSHKNWLKVIPSAWIAKKEITPFLELTGEQIFLETQYGSIESISRQIIERFGIKKLNGYHLANLIKKQSETKEGEEKSFTEGFFTETEVEDNPKYIAYKNLCDFIKNDEAKLPAKHQANLQYTNEFNNYIDTCEITATQLTKLLLKKPNIISYDIIEKIFALQMEEVLQGSPRKLYTDELVKNNLTGEIGHAGEEKSEVPLDLLKIISEYAATEAEYNPENLFKLFEARPDLREYIFINDKLILNCPRDDLFTLLSFAVRFIQERGNVPANENLIKNFVHLILENDIFAKLSGKEIDEIYNLMVERYGALNLIAPPWLTYIKGKEAAYRNINPKKHKDNFDAQVSYNYGKKYNILRSDNHILKSSKLSGKEIVEIFGGLLEMSKLNSWDDILKVLDINFIYQEILKCENWLYVVTNLDVIPFSRYQLKKVLTYHNLCSDDFKPKNLTGYDLFDLHVSNEQRHKFELYENLPTENERIHLQEAKNENDLLKGFNALNGIYCWNNLDFPFLKNYLQHPELSEKYHAAFSKVNNITIDEMKDESAVTREQQLILKYSYYYSNELKEVRARFQKACKEEKIIIEAKKNNYHYVIFAMKKYEMYLERGMNLGIVPCFELAISLSDFKTNFLMYSENHKKNLILKKCLELSKHIQNAKNKDRLQEKIKHILYALNETGFTFLHGVPLSHQYEEFVPKEIKEQHVQESEEYRKSFILGKAKEFYNLARNKSFRQQLKGNYFKVNHTYEELEADVKADKKKQDRKVVCMELAIFLYNVEHQIGRTNNSVFPSVDPDILSQLTNPKYEKVLAALYKMKGDFSCWRYSIECDNALDLLNGLFAENRERFLPSPDTFLKVPKEKHGFFSSGVAQSNNNINNNSNNNINNTSNSNSLK